MKSSLLKQSKPLTACSGMLAGLAALLLWTWPATAGEKQAVESVGVIIGFDPGQTSVTPSGNVHIRGFSEVEMIVSENPLTTGRLTVVGDWNGDAELKGVGSGTSTFEVGTWDLSSGAPVFIPSPTGGLWRSVWEGNGTLGGQATLHAIGHGVAGEVAGMVYTVEGQAATALPVHYIGWLLDPHANK